MDNEIENAIQQNNKKFIFVINAKYLTKSYSVKDILEIDYQTILQEFEKQNPNIENPMITGQIQGINIKDCKDKEIYEKYIVDVVHPCWSEKCIVEFKNGSFIFRCITKNDVQNIVIPGYTFMKEKWKVKILGNIFENPELLK